jgi:hypothetical protein
LSTAATGDPNYLDLWSVDRVVQVLSIPAADAASMFLYPVKSPSMSTPFWFFSPL